MEEGQGGLKKTVGVYTKSGNERAEEVAVAAKKKALRETGR